MTSLRIDMHAHLYDCFNLRDWVMHAVSNLSVSKDTQGVVIVADRYGQDSFQRFRREIPAFAEWSERKDNNGCCVGTIHAEGYQLFVIQGVQYVTSERVEVLALASQRVLPDGATCRETIEASIEAGALVCLPWSPGKWLGERGRLVAGMLSDLSTQHICIGDISVHSRWWPRSRLIEVARSLGFACVAGTDALNRSQDCALVGSYGVSSTTAAPVHATDIVPFIREISSRNLALWGAPNDFVTASRRFISSLL